MNAHSTLKTLVAVAAAGVTVAACGGTSTSATTTSDSAYAAVKKDATAAALLPASWASKGTVNVASDIPFAPMEMFDAHQHPTGFDYDLSQALARKLGVKFNFQEQSFDTIIPSLISGKHDIIISGMNDKKERQKSLDFVDYLHGGMAIMVLEGNPHHITTLLDLCGQTVSVQKATTQADLLRSTAPQCAAKGKSPIKVSELPAESDAELAVRSGKSVADVLDAAVASYNVKTAGNGKTFEVVKDPANPNGYAPVYSGIGVLKSETGLTKAIQAALQSLIDDGTYAKLLATYGLSSYAVPSATINQGS